MPKFAMSLATWAEGMRQAVHAPVGLGQQQLVHGVPVTMWEGLLLQELASLLHLWRHRVCHRDIKVRLVGGGLLHTCCRVYRNCCVFLFVLLVLFSQSDQWFIDRKRGRVVLADFGSGAVYCRHTVEHPSRWPDVPFEDKAQAGGDASYTLLPLWARWHGTLLL
jgi:serine/threonine protein kinase